MGTATLNTFATWYSNNNECLREKFFQRVSVLDEERKIEENEEAKAIVFNKIGDGVIEPKTLIQGKKLNKNVHHIRSFDHYLYI